MNKVFLILILFLILGFMFCFVGKVEISENIKWGVIFSQTQSKQLGLDWKENYIALLDDLNFKDIKIITNWNLIERDNNIYSFTNLDWQIEEAGKRNVDIMMRIGDCDFPQWIKSDLKEESLSYLNTLILMYEDNPYIKMWELGFEECLDQSLISEQIEFIKSKSNKPILNQDIIGLSLYKKKYIPKFKIYFNNPIAPIFYTRKVMFMDKDVLVSELQGQPMGPIPTYEMRIDEWKKSMNASLFKKNIQFAKKTGLNTFYLTGGEWWYLLKTRGDSEIWDFMSIVLAK